MTDYLALLRGINVGGRNRVPMQELMSAMEADGLRNVAYYLQSGNVLFESDETDRPALAERVSGLVETNFDARSPVVLRTRDELDRTVTRNPFLADEDEFKWLHVLFIDAAPDDGAIGKLDPERSPGDRFEVDGREVFVHYPNGSGRSKLTIDYFERVLGVTATGRNWNTVTRLAALLAERSGG